MKSKGGFCVQGAPLSGHIISSTPLISHHSHDFQVLTPTIYFHNLVPMFFYLPSFVVLPPIFSPEPGQLLPSRQNPICSLFPICSFLQSPFQALDPTYHNVLSLTSFLVRLPHKIMILFPYIYQIPKIMPRPK